MKTILCADMREYTTMRTGGAADVLLMPESAEELVTALKDNRDAIVLGGGSNVIVRDGGIRGTVVRTTALRGVEIDGDIARAMAGTTLFALVKELHKAELIGLEFASGIPGTVGGGVYMNAGAFGGEIKDFLTEIQVFDRDLGELRRIPAAELELGYRTSRLMRERWVLVSAEFKLERGDIKAAKEKAAQYAAARKEKQPLEYPSSGSTFKRPEGHFAGKLIQDCGLKGASVGGAQVSPKHAGFVVNTGGATSGDVLKLIEHVRREVYAQTGVLLEPEVRVVGEE